MNEIRTLKGNKIYLTKNPARIVNSKIETVVRIKMSCGGGMGGSKWYETIKPTTIKPNTLIQVETIEGETKLINTNFIVEAVEKQLITITEIHQNHNAINYLYLAPMNVEVEIMNKYRFTDEWVI